MNDESDATLGDRLTDEAEEEPGGDFDQARIGRILSRALGTLTSRERTVLEMRFGLAGGPRMTLKEIGSEIGLSRERVRQIQAGALERLRARPDVRRFADYLPDAPTDAAA